MGQYDNLSTDRLYHKVTCECGAIYEIGESDGEPGCRDIEVAYCQFCDKELARNFGDCFSRLLDSESVDFRLKMAKQRKDEELSNYIEQYGYDIHSAKYKSIFDNWKIEICDCLSEKK